MKRNLLSIFILCFAAACLALAFSSCNNNEDKKPGTTETGNEETYTKGLEYTLDARTNTYYVTGRGNAQHLIDVIIPKLYNGVPVTGIRASAFTYYSPLESITLPESITNLSANAFSGCTNLASINIPENVTVINRNTFENCTSLKELTLPDGIISIGESAFAGCKSLSKINIPDSVTKIDNYAFSGCLSLTAITIPTSVKNLIRLSFNNCPALTVYCKAKGKPIEWSDDWNSSDFSLFLPAHPVIWDCENNSKDENGFEYVSDGKFKYSIKDGTATLFSMLYTTDNEIVIPDKVTVNGSETRLIKIGRSAFAHNKIVKTITIPNGVTEIEDYAFYYPSAFEMSSITQYSPPQLHKVIMPDSIKTIGNYAFFGQKSLNISEKSITLPAELEVIGEYAFKECWCLKNVILPDSVTQIGAYAFKDCTYLTGINIPEGVTAINEATFQSCSSLENITIPDSVTKIGRGTFRDCTSLTSIIIPKNVTEIGEFAFTNCTSLTSITIPDSVTYINQQAFSRCTSLTSIIIPDSVTYIGHMAFYACTLLTIYCEAKESPEDWFENWNFSNCPVVWEYKQEN